MGYVVHWEQDEDDIMEAYYSNKPMHWLIERLQQRGRTEGSIYQRAAYLKLNRKPQRFKREELMRYYLDKLLPAEKENKQDNVFPKFLDRLQYDRYYPNLKLAFEHNGLQHYEPWGNSENSLVGFEKCKERDARKQRLSDFHNITLIVVKYDEDLNVEVLKQKILTVRPDIVLNSNIPVEPVDRPEDSNDYWWDSKDDQHLKEHWITDSQVQLMKDLECSWQSIRSRVLRKLPELFPLREARLRDGDWLPAEDDFLREGIEKGLTDEQISDFLASKGIKRSDNSIVRRRFDLDLKKHLSSDEIWTNDNVKWLKTNYNESRERIADFLKCDWQTVHKKLVELGIHRERTGVYDEEEIKEIDRLLKEGKSHREISVELERPFFGIESFIQINGEKYSWIRKKVTVEKDYKDVEGLEDRIIELYKQGRTCAEIATEVGRTKDGIARKLRGLGCHEKRVSEPKEWSSDDIKTLEEEAAKGTSCREIATKLGRGVVGVRRALYKYVTSKAR